MTRMQSDDDGKSVITIRVDDDLREQYKDAVATMSQDLREHIRQTVDDATHDGTSNPIKNQLLADAYDVIRDQARIRDPNERKVNAEIAAEKVSEHTRIPKDAVKKRVFYPLENLGFIQPQNGTIHVYPTEEVVQGNDKQD